MYRRIFVQNLTFRTRKVLVIIIKLVAKYRFRAKAMLFYIV